MQISRTRLFETLRGPIPQPACSLSTLRSPGRPGTTQDSLPAGGPALPDGSSTRWVTLLSFCNVDGHMASSKSELSWRTVSRGSGFGEARRESHIRTQTRRMKSYGSRTCGLESPSNLAHPRGAWTLPRTTAGWMAGHIGERRRAYLAARRESLQGDRSFSGRRNRGARRCTEESHRARRRQARLRIRDTRRRGRTRRTFPHED